MANLMVALEPVPTADQALDAALGGGLLPGGTLLVYGPPGTGKSTLAAQFACHDASKKEPGLLLLAGEPIATVSARLTTQGIISAGDLAEGKLHIVDFRSVAHKLNVGDVWSDDDRLAVVDAIDALLEATSAKRLAIDPLEALLERCDGPVGARDLVGRLALVFMDRGVTSCIAAETNTAAHWCDAVVSLCSDDAGVVMATAVKSRGQANTPTPMVATINDKGIQFKSPDKGGKA